MGKSKMKGHDRKKKVAVVFDEAKRKDFLCGFRKRKLERKKKAQEDIQRMLKEEKKRIKQENKESYKKLVVSSRPIPDIEQLLKEEYEDEDVNVKIMELSTETLQKKDLVIGENRPRVTEKKVEIKKKKTVESVPGMGSEEEETSADEEDGKDTDTKLKTKKEIKRMLKHQATKKLQKSKVFQMKSKLDRVKNKKQAEQKKNRMAKVKGKDSRSTNKTKKKIGRRKH